MLSRDIMKGNKNMKKAFVIFCVFPMLLTFSGVAAAVDVDWSHLDQIHLDKNPVDVAISANGELIFILAEGEILIFSTREDRIINKIPVDKKFDKILHSEKDNTLILSGRTSKVIKRIQIDFVYPIDISGLPVKGPETAPVTIVVFDDYQCPYCARLNPTLDQVMKKHSKDVKLVIKHFPLRMHKFAKKAARAALAANEQGKFWEYHDMVFENHKGLNDDKFLEFSKALNLNEEKFKSDMDSKKIRDRIEKDMADGKKAGVRGTPTVFINGKRLKVRSLQGFEKMIKKELEKKNRSDETRSSSANNAFGSRAFSGHFYRADIKLIAIYPYKTFPV